MIVSDSRVAEFVSKKLGVALCPPMTALGIDKDGEIIAGVVFNCFEGAAVHVTVAGTGWTRAFVRDVGRYVFRQLGCLRMTVTSEHWQIVEYAVRLGGSVEGNMRDHFGRGRDAIIVGILRDDWAIEKLGESG